MSDAQEYYSRQTYGPKPEGFRALPEVGVTGREQEVDDALIPPGWIGIAGGKLRVNYFELRARSDASNTYDKVVPKIATGGASLVDQLHTSTTGELPSVVLAGTTQDVVVHMEGSYAADGDYREQFQITEAYIEQVNVGAMPSDTDTDKYFLLGTFDNTDSDKPIVQNYVYGHPFVNYDRAKEQIIQPTFVSDQWWRITGLDTGSNKISIWKGLVIAQVDDVSTVAQHSSREYKEYFPGPWDGANAVTCLVGDNYYWVKCNLEERKVVAVDYSPPGANVTNVTNPIYEYMYGIKLGWTNRVDLHVERTAGLTPPAVDSTTTKYQFLGYIDRAGATFDAVEWRLNHAVDFRIGSFVLGDSNYTGGATPWTPLIGS